MEKKRVLNGMAVGLVQNFGDIGTIITQRTCTLDEEYT